MRAYLFTSKQKTNFNLREVGVQCNELRDFIEHAYRWRHRIIRSHYNLLVA